MVHGVSRRLSAFMHAGLSRGELLVAHASTSNAPVPDRLIITKPDDWHLHVRDGATMRNVVPHTARQFGRAIIMPNLAQPVTTAVKVGVKSRHLPSSCSHSAGHGQCTTHVRLLARIFHPCTAMHATRAAVMKHVHLAKR